MTMFEATVAPMFSAVVAMKPAIPVPTPGSATASAIWTAKLTADRSCARSCSFSSS